MTQDNVTRVVIVGAGSLEFSARLTADLLSFTDLRPLHLCLVDPDSERLDFAGQIVDRIVATGEYSGVTWSQHEDRRDALPGASFVITSILVGGFDAIRSEIDIPAKYGVSQAIGDTLTPGGIMRCLRTLPHQADIARDVQALCPNAMVLNYTNPMAMLCWGMTTSVPEINLVGLCHSVQGTTGQWAHRLDVPLAEVNFECAGINHQAWITRFEHAGQDLLPRIRTLAETPALWRKDTSRMEYIKHFGYPVTEASGHNSEYSPWFRKNAAVVDRYCPGGGWNGAHGFIKTLYDRPDWRETMTRLASGETPIDLSRSVEYGAHIINAAITNEPLVIHGNVPNTGLIDNLPDDACVEVACVIDRNGIAPVHYGTLPAHLAAINSNQINVQRLAVMAALEADPELVFQAMCLDPLTGAVLTLDEIRSMTAELLLAHAAWFPEPLRSRPLAPRPTLFN